MIDLELTVILTACVNPSAPVVRNDPAVRLADYRAGLRFWLEHRDPRIRRIIFIENSGHPLDTLERTARADNPRQRACEFISLECNVLPPGLNYGYNEFQLLDLGLARSRLYAESPALVKATGRYGFPSISRLLDRLPTDCVFAGDSRDNHRFTPYPQRFTASALLFFTREFYERQIRTLYQTMAPPPAPRKQFIEDLLFDHLSPLRGQSGVVLRWPVNCDPAGIGANNDVYGSPRKRLLAAARAVGRRAFPDWWF